LLPGFGITGGVNVVFEHANRLKARGHSVRVLSASAENKVDWLPQNQVSTFSVRDTSIWADYINWSPDVLVLTSWHTVYEAKLLGLTASHFVYFVQSDERRFQKGTPSDLAHLTYQENVHYLTEARWIRDLLFLEFGHTAIYAPNAINHEIFHPRPPLAPKGGRLRVLLEGPVTIDFKRMNDAFLAVRGMDVEVWCVVSDAIPNDWRYADRFFLRVPHDKMPEIYSSCDVLIKMSAVEGFFGPPLEMMACGGTAIVTRVTGYDEYIVDGENALTVEIGDFKKARQHLQRLIFDRPLLESLKANGLKTAQEFYWEKTVDIVEKNFLSIASNDDLSCCTQAANPAMAIATYCFKSIHHGNDALPHFQFANDFFHSRLASFSEAEEHLFVVQGWACERIDPNGWPSKYLTRTRAAKSIPLGELILTADGIDFSHFDLESRSDRPDVADALNLKDRVGQGYGFMVTFRAPAEPSESITLRTKSEKNVVSHVDYSRSMRGFKVQIPDGSQCDFDRLFMVADEPFDIYGYLVDPIEDGIIPVNLSASKSGDAYSAFILHSYFTDYRFVGQNVLLYLNAKPTTMKWIRAGAVV